MWWGPEGKWWKGTVLMTGRGADDTQNRRTNTSDEDQFFTVFFLNLLFILVRIHVGNSRFSV